MKSGFVFSNLLFCFFCLGAAAASVRGETLSFKKAFFIKKDDSHLWGTQTYLVRGRFGTQYYVNLDKVSPMTETTANRIRDFEIDVIYLCESKFYYVVGGEIQINLFDIKNCTGQPRLSDESRKDQRDLARAAKKLEREVGSYNNQ